MTLKPHPLAEMFPTIEGEEFAHFADDIRLNGLQDQIVLLEDLILDGRNRYRALLHIHGVKYKLAANESRVFNPATEGDPLAWVLSRNLARRHLVESQRAMVAARLADMPAHRPPDKCADLRTSQDEAASRLRVSRRLVQLAKQILEKGIPDLVRLVTQGHMAVDHGALAAQQDGELQAKIVALVLDGKANVARTATKKAVRDAREKVLGEKISALPDGKFGVILGDPEWTHVSYSDVTGKDRAAENHYPCSSEKEISDRDVEKIAAKDCMLALWVTDLARGIRVMEAWGFTFKSYFVWAKDIVPLILTAEQRLAAGIGGGNLWIQVGAAGTGFWSRDRDEILLIGTRGKFVAPAMGTQPESVMFAARPKIEGKNRAKHSAKPSCVHEWIEKNWPNTPKIEMNARKARDGWTLWGNEAPEANAKAAGAK